MSDEFRVHHCANQLIHLLKIEGGQTAADCTDHLLQNRTPFITTQVNTHSASLHISENATKPQEFINKFEELKAKNVRNIGSLVHLLSNIINDNVLHKTLTNCAVVRGDALKLIPQHPPSGLGSSLVNLPPSGTKLSQQQLHELRTNLEKATLSTAEANRKFLQDRYQARKLNFSIPMQPHWLSGPKQKPFLTYNFSFNTRSQVSPTYLGHLSTHQQEQEIIKDLLIVLSGIEGCYIFIRHGEDKNSPRKFIVDETIDVSLVEMIHLIIPIASYYSIVVNFIEERSAFEYGQVNHALVAAMKNILKEYQVNLAQLDDQYRQGLLNLQRLIFLLQPVLQQMSILSNVATSVDRGNCIGGAVLSLLHKQILASVGNKKAQQMYTYLAEVANIPYLEMLEKWIYKGEIMDNYGEFLVEEREKFSKDKLLDEYNDQYWESRYTLCRERIPVYLEQMADKILSTGKYLNVVHECGKKVSFPGAREIVYDYMKQEYIHQIEEAHSYASQLLLDLLMQEHNLAAHLRSVKAYFLLNDGDFLLNFMDLTENEMKMPMVDIIPNRLEALLELAIRTSISENDPYKDDLKVVLLNYDLITQLVRILSIDTVEENFVKSLDPTELNLTGLESFALDYTVHWPLSLVISRKSLTKYQMLFRHLFYCKHVERHLSTVWLKFKGLKKDFIHSKHWFVQAMTILQKMLHFIQNFEYYMIFEVLEPNWMNLERKLKIAKNVDEVLDSHTDFLRQCLQDCLLTNTDMLRILSKLLMLCVSFSNFMSGINRQVDVPMLKETLEHSTLSGPPTAQEKRYVSDCIDTTSEETITHLKELSSSHEHLSTVNLFEENFSLTLMTLLNRVTYVSREQGQHCLFNILHKLDYNGYYRSQMKDGDSAKEIDLSLCSDLIKQHHKLSLQASKT